MKPSSTPFKLPNIKATWPEIVAALLVLLFVYTAVSKLADLHKFISEMHKQNLPGLLTDILIWTLPPLEILTAVLLILDRTRLSGLYAGLILLSIFTGYIGLVLLNVFGQVPCSCGGVIKALGWKLHLLFNLFFLLLTLSAIYLINRERRRLSAG